jgi:hypothetical protein
LDDETIPLTKVIELVVGNGHLHGLVLREVWRLEFVLPFLFYVILLVVRVVLLLLLIEGGTMLLNEEVHVA